MDKLVERLVEMDAKATPASALDVSRYSHGGARVCQGDNLIADFYDEDNRECFLAARNALPALVEYVTAEECLHYIASRSYDSEVWSFRDAGEYEAASVKLSAARAALLSALGGDK